MLPSSNVKDKQHIIEIQVVKGYKLEVGERDKILTFLVTSYLVLSLYQFLPLKLPRANTKKHIHHSINLHMHLKA